jgi:hypothetical protein
MANRMTSLRELQAISGQFDDVGRRNLTRDIVSTRVGHDLANRYAPAVEEKRPTIDSKIALMENQMLQSGAQIEVISNELHGVHLEAHVPVLNQLIEQINTGAADPQQAMPILQSFYQHISQQAEFASGDPALQSIVGQTKQVLQIAEEAINNVNKHLEKLQRDQQQNPQSAGQQQQASPVDLKMQEHEMKMQIAKQKAELDFQIKQRKFDQEQAMRDSKNALDLREKFNP